MARYDSARATPKAVVVTGPALPPSIRSATGAAGPAPLPTLNTKPPLTGWASADTTR